ncbi:MAG: ribonuclease HII, partial [Alphaproteobacteria bacterium]
MPDLALEIAAGGTVAGIDEAGRGPWAGPVMAAAVILDTATLPGRLADAIDDSKKLSAARRHEVFAALGAYARIGVGSASVAEIDTHNVLAATMRAMRRALAALGTPPDLALVDGNRTPDLPCPAKAVVRG